MEDVKKIVIVSDGTGKTARRLLDAVLAQYEDQHVPFEVARTYQQIVTEEHVDDVLKEIHRDYLVIFSIISDDLRRYLRDHLEEKQIPYLNVLEPMLETMSKFLGVHPEYRPGLLQIIDDRYYRKIDAIGYAVEHDDGRGYRIEEAELVLVGPSRTCKTPISMYIACNHGLRVVNIPIVPSERVKEQLLRRLSTVDPRVVFGVLMQPEELARVREERATVLLPDDLGKERLNAYYDIHEIRNELQFCRALYKEQRWETVDVTKRAIEEISLEIIKKLKVSGDR